MESHVSDEPSVTGAERTTPPFILLFGIFGVVPAFVYLSCLVQSTSRRGSLFLFSQAGLVWRWILMRSRTRKHGWEARLMH